MSILSRLKQNGINAEGGNRVYLPGDDFVTQMRKRTQKAIDDISPQVQSEMVRPYKAESYGMHEYYQVPPPGIDWEPPIWEPLPLPEFRIATPIFSLVSGAYVRDTKFTITCLTAGVDIHYTITLSGAADEPTQTSNKYSGAPIPIIWDTMIVKAKAFKEGMESSSTATVVYTIIPAGWTSYFNNTKWTAVEDDGGSWDGSKWISELDLVFGSGSNHFIQLNVSGTWYKEYRPTKCRVTHTGPAANTVLQVRYVGGGRNLVASYASLDELLLTNIGDNNITQLLIYNNVPSAFSVTNIEFYG